MKSRHVLVASALALALSACGQSPAPSAEPPVAAPATETAATPAPVETAPVEAAPVATGSKPATVGDCATTITSNDAMQYDADSIAVPATCTQFTITLKHAGTMAVKKTHELIPFCHPLPIDGCRFSIDWHDARTLRIECTVGTTHRTGVEMEALTGATVAALTVYDMCKALSHAIVIGPAKLLGKRGGKRDIGQLA